jgi:hypothetical protein
MAKDCKNERLAMTMQFVALGSMIVMAGAAGVHLMREMFSHTEHHGKPDVLIVLSCFFTLSSAGLGPA